MSTNFSSIFNNKAHAEDMRSVHAACGASRHRSLLDYNQSRAARRAAANQEVTPFDFNIGWYQVSPSDTLFYSCKIDL